MSTVHVRNILRVYRGATDEQVRAGMNWYADVAEMATEMAHGDIWRGAGVIAAFSPQMGWERNVELAYDAFRTGFASTKCLGNSHLAAQRILDGEFALDVLRGNKTSAFCANIANAGFSDAVTIDSHAYSVAVGHKVFSSQMPSLGVKRYAEFANAYSRAAERAGIMPTQMQAVTWEAWRAL